MIIQGDPEFLSHASKYKGGFTKDGKNTSAYNHDYYMKNKDKWKKKGEQIEGAPEGVTYDPHATVYAYEDGKVGWSDWSGKYEYHGLDNNFNPQYRTSAHGQGTRKRNGGVNQGNMWLSDFDKEYAKKAKVFKRGEGIGGGPSGNANYEGRSTPVKKRKKGRKPVGKVWNVEY